jgi:hypothetical protein
MLETDDAAAELTQAEPLLVSTFPDVPTAESPVPPYAAVTGVVRAIFGVSPPVDVIGAVAVTLVMTPPAASAYTDLMLVPSLDMIRGLFLGMTTLVPPAADAMVTVHGPVLPLSDVVLLTIHCPPAITAPVTIGSVYMTFPVITPEIDSDRDRYCATVKVTEPEVAVRRVTPPNA